jgi:hypothetical protein
MMLGMMTPQIGSWASIIISWINEFSRLKGFSGWDGQ